MTLTLTLGQLLECVGLENYWVVVKRGDIMQKVSSIEVSGETIVINLQTSRVTKSKQKQEAKHHA